MTTRRALVLLVGVLILAACDSETTGGTTTSSVEPSTSEATTIPTTIAPTTLAPTTIAPTTTVPGELFFVDGALLGINLGTELSFAEAAIGVTAVPFDYDGFHTTENACTSTDDAVQIETGGWTLVFETDRRGAPAVPATVMTNWIYVGGPAAGYTGIVAPGDVRVGDPRSDLEAANPGFTDLVRSIYVFEPFELYYGVESGNVDWFGMIVCLLEE